MGRQYFDFNILFRFSEVLKEIVVLAVPEASVRDICIAGDKRLAEETAKAFKKDKKVLKGNSTIFCMGYFPKSLISSEDDLHYHSIFIFISLPDCKRFNKRFE